MNETTNYAYVSEDDLDALGDIEEVTLQLRWNSYEQPREYVFKGELLGSASSHKPSHKHEPGANPPAPGADPIRCSGCMWTEIKIYQQYEDRPDGLAYGQYIVVIEGFSLIPGHSHRTRGVWADTPVDMIKGLCSGEPPQMSFLARTALRKASETDQMLAEDFAAFERISPAAY